MKFFDSIKKDFNTMTWVLMPVAIAINIAIGQIVVLLKLPVYLDSIGTVLVAAVCGPWAGALTGALSNTIWGLAIDPNALPWWPVAFFIGCCYGFFGRTYGSDSFNTNCRLYLRRHYSQRIIIHHCVSAPNRSGCFASCVQHQLPGGTSGQNHHSNVGIHYRTRAFSTLYSSLPISRKC
jgi:hypothetical protein